MAAERNAVTVIGSAHVDLIAKADRLPVRGESLTGVSFAMSPGGKAGNQATQVALNGVPAYLVAHLGDDEFGRDLLKQYQSKGVDTSHVSIDASIPTGASPLLVGGDGEYASIIVPGAAAHLSISNIAAARSILESSWAVMLQLEIPFPTTLFAARLAAEMGTKVVLNASPVHSPPAAFPSETWIFVDILIVNRLEAERLIAVSELSALQTSALAGELRAKLNVEMVVITDGERGAVACGRQECLSVTAPKVNVVDTIGAGDAFAGVLVSELAQGSGLEVALSRASAAGALTVTRPGAFDALPTRSEIRALAANGIARKSNT